MRASIKKRVWCRDKYTCFYCGKKDLKDPTVDHIIPQKLLSDGEKSNITNLVTACKTCNQKKADLSPINPPSIRLRAYQVHI